jgi:hypothetical protein
MLFLWTLDQSGTNLAAFQAINADRETPVKVRLVKYSSNIVEEDHRAIKRRTGPMPAPTGLFNHQHPQNLQPMRTPFAQAFFVICEAIVCWLKLKKDIGEAEMAQRHANLE